VGRRGGPFVVKAEYDERHIDGVGLADSLQTVFSAF
jgi:hypothetical protein